MATIKKLVGGILAALCLVFAVPGVAFAGVANPPVGTLINGWYKDSASVLVQYGNGTCTGPGTANSYTFHLGAAQEGQHSYGFMFDQLDNPYYVVDATSPPQPLITPLPCPAITQFTALTGGQQFPIWIDAYAPSVSITSPSNGTVTDQATYQITGTASDGQGSGVQSVQLFVNGVGGQTASAASTFSFTAQLAMGTNSIFVQALDRVGHVSNSNVVTITRSTITGGGTTGGGTTGSSTGSSAPTAATPSSSSTTTNVTSNALKFLNGSVIKLNNGALDRPSDPALVLAETGFPAVDGWLLGILIALVLGLVAANLIVIWRFRPVFARLDRSNSGLRRRIIIIVSLPSLVPVFGLGFLAYQQLSNSLQAALSQELARAAQTSAIKLEREFAIRTDVITTNSNDIFQIKDQYKTQYAQLASQKDTCSKLIAGGKTSKISTDVNCLPFLDVLGQLSSATVTQYQTALTAAYTNTLTSMQADEQQRTDALLASIRDYFPDVTELALTDASSIPQVVASLPASGSSHPVLQDHKALLATVSKDTTTLFDATHRPGQALFAYPIIDNKGTLLGQAVVAYDTEYSAFIPVIWQATPKPYSVDKVYFLSSSGQQIYPLTGAHISQAEASKVTAAGSGSLVKLTVADELLATRVDQVQGTGWTIAVGAPPNSILAPVANVQRVALLAIACFLLLSLLLGIVFVSGVATEIEALYQGAIHYAKGELDYAIRLAKHDELRMLGDTMNQMAVDIKAAQAALVEKDKEFINITSHELKAPMTAILGNLSMILEDGMGTVDQTARNLISEAYRGTQRLKALVTDMLDVARLEAGKAQFSFKPVDLIQLTQDIVNMQAIPAQQASVTVQYQPEQDLPHVMADESKLQIIITNFVSNAIKYNRPNGTITITQKVQDGMVLTAVADSGLGIPDDQKAHIFEKFYRVQHQDRANVPGTGLGMYITKRFIEAMSGKVWFDSVHGQGTTFYFTMPIAAQATPRATPAQPAMPTSGL